MRGAKHELHLHSILSIPEKCNEEREREREMMQHVSNTVWKIFA